MGLGVITRAAPALNIFAVGFPAMILGGFVVVANVYVKHRLSYYLVMATSHLML